MNTQTLNIIFFPSHKSSFRWILNPVLLLHLHSTNCHCSASSLDSIYCRGEPSSQGRRASINKHAVEMEEPSSFKIDSELKEKLTKMIWMNATQVTNICGTQWLPQMWNWPIKMGPILTKNVTSLYLNAVFMWKNKINAWRKLYRGSWTACRNTGRQSSGCEKDSSKNCCTWLCIPLELGDFSLADWKSKWPLFWNNPKLKKIIYLSEKLIEKSFGSWIIYRRRFFLNHEVLIFRILRKSVCFCCYLGR